MFKLDVERCLKKETNILPQKRFQITNLALFYTSDLNKIDLLFKDKMKAKIQ